MLPHLCRSSASSSQQESRSYFVRGTDIEPYVPLAARSTRRPSTGSACRRALTLRNTIGVAVMREWDFRPILRQARRGFAHCRSAFAAWNCRNAAHGAFDPIKPTLRLRATRNGFQAIEHPHHLGRRRRLVSVEGREPRIESGTRHQFGSRSSSEVRDGVSE